MSSTFAEMMMRTEEGQLQLKAAILSMDLNYFQPLTRFLFRRINRQRPFTDDMIQMCVDLGIEVPDYPFPSYDDITFKLWSQQ